MTNIQKSRGAAPATFYLPSSSEIARCFQAGVPKVEQGLIKRGEWGAGLLGRLAVPCTIPAFHAGREQGCSWVLWDNALPCVCVRERERDSGLNCSNSSGVSCGSCLPAQSNSVLRFRRGNEESWTRLELQGGF